MATFLPSLADMQKFDKVIDEIEPGFISFNIRTHPNGWNIKGNGKF